MFPHLLNPEDAEKKGFQNFPYAWNWRIDNSRGEVMVELRHTFFMGPSTGSVARLLSLLMYFIKP